MNLSWHTSKNDISLLQHYVLVKLETTYGNGRTNEPVQIGVMGRRHTGSRAGKIDKQINHIREKWSTK